MQPVVVITGASAGIGAELARRFGQHGHRLVLVARRDVQLQKLADDIATAGHQRPHVIALDLESEGGTARLAQALCDRAATARFLEHGI